MNFFEREMRMMFHGSEIIQEPKYCGKTMLGKLDDNLRVKLEYIATGIAGQYNALRLTIINRTDGVVDKGVFKFSDVLGQYIRPNLSAIDYHMWEYQNRSQWYIPITASQREAFAGRVLDYIGMYQDQSMTIGEQSM